jgi:hypothetical protein
METLLSSGKGKTPKLTSKQKAFAHAVALGETKAEAYRKSYKQDATQHTLNTQPYILARDLRIAKEIEAYQLALEAEKHRNPVQLKALLVQQLVQHSLDEGFPPAQRMKALQMIGNLFEVGAFLERKEVTTVRKSTDIRTRLLERLGTLTPVIVDDALTLMDEIKGNAVAISPPSAPTAPVPTHEAVPAPVCTPHTVSDNQSLSPNNQSPNMGVGVSKNPDEVFDFDKK